MTKSRTATAFVCVSLALVSEALQAQDPALAAHAMLRTTAATPALLGASGMVLQEGTPVRMRLSRTLSSAQAQVGDTLDFEVLDDVKLGDTVVIPIGATAIATVTEGVAKRRMGRAGKLNVNVVIGDN